MSTLDKAIEHIRMGNQEAGRQILEELLDVNENDETIWLWLSLAVESDDDREICLENAAALDPGNEIAQSGLEALRSGIFDPNDLLSELLDEGEIDEEYQDDDIDEPATFIDDFVINDDDTFDDDDFGFADTDEEDTKKGGFNPRYLILGVLVLILIVVLGALAFASTFLVGNDGGQPPAGEGTPAQEVPAGGENGSGGEEQAPEATATPTETPTPAATDTPTATPTSALQLPTSRPTDEPTPTATRVVSPTPIR